MKCPYCNEEMKKGYIQSARQIFWSEKKRKVVIVPAKGDVVLSEGSLGGHVVEAFCCLKCKKIIVEFTESKTSII